MTNHPSFCNNSVNMKVGMAVISLDTTPLLLFVVCCH